MRYDCADVTLLSTCLGRECRQAESAGVAQAGEGSRETLDPIPVPEGTARELEKDFREGPGVTG